MWSSYLLPDTPIEMGDLPRFCVIQMNNVTNNPLTRDTDRWVAFPHPQVVIQYYDGKTGRLKFAHTISKKKTIPHKAPIIVFSRLSTLPCTN